MRSMSTANIINLEDDTSYLDFISGDEYSIDLSYRYSRRCDSSKPTIIFVHDCRKTRDSWNNVINDNIMQQNFIMYSINIRGYGKSPCGKRNNYTINYLIKDIHNFIKSLNINKAILVGEGCGAKLIAEYKNNYSDTIIACILYNFEIDHDEKWNIENEEFINRLETFTRIHNYYEENDEGLENPLHYKSAKDELKRCGYTNKEIEYLFSEDGEGCHYVDNVIDLMHYSVVIGLHPLADCLYENISKNIDIWKCLEQCNIPVLIVQIKDSNYDLSSIHYRKIKQIDTVRCISIEDFGDIWPPYKELIKNLLSFVEQVIEDLEQKSLIDELW